MSEMYVFSSHQSDWIYFKQPIRFLVVKVNGMWGDLIPIQFRKVRPRILVMDEMSLEV